MSAAHHNYLVSVPSGQVSLIYTTGTVYHLERAREDHLVFKPFLGLELRYTLYDTIKAEIQLGGRCSVTVFVMIMIVLMM